MNAENYSSTADITKSTNNINDNENSKKPKEHHNHHGIATKKATDLFYSHYNKKWGWIVYCSMFLVLFLTITLPFLILSLDGNKYSGLYEGSVLLAKKAAYQNLGIAMQTPPSVRTEEQNLTLVTMNMTPAELGLAVTTLNTDGFIIYNRNRPLYKSRSNFCLGQLIIASLCTNIFTTLCNGANLLQFGENSRDYYYIFAMMIVVSHQMFLSSLTYRMRLIHKIFTKKISFNCTPYKVYYKYAPVDILICIISIVPAIIDCVGTFGDL
eukprot:Pgem_evm2s16762